MFLVNGRNGAGPSHRSQERYPGTGSVLTLPSSFRGRPSPWAQTGRLVQTWTSLISPRAPLRITSTPSRRPSLAVPWLPIWVQTPFSAASSRSTRASRMLQVRGFWTNACLPIAIAITAAGAWVWSGVETVTASILSPMSASITRKSANFLASGANSSSRLFALSSLRLSMSQRATVWARSAASLESDDPFPSIPMLAKFSRCMGLSAVAWRARTGDWGRRRARRPPRRRPRRRRRRTGRGSSGGWSASPCESRRVGGIGTGPTHPNGGRGVAGQRGRAGRVRFGAAGPGTGKLPGPAPDVRPHDRPVAETRRPARRRGGVRPVRGPVRRPRPRPAAGWPRRWPCRRAAAAGRARQGRPPAAGRPRRGPRAGRRADQLRAVRPGRRRPHGQTARGPVRLPRPEPAGRRNPRPAVRRQPVPDRHPRSEPGLPPPAHGAPPTPRLQESRRLPPRSPVGGRRGGRPGRPAGRPPPLPALGTAADRGLRHVRAAGPAERHRAALPAGGRVHAILPEPAVRRTGGRRRGVLRAGLREARRGGAELFVRHRPGLPRRGGRHEVLDARPAAHQGPLAGDRGGLPVPRGHAAAAVGAERAAGQYARGPPGVPPQARPGLGAAGPPQGPPDRGEPGPRPGVPAVRRAADLRHAGRRGAGQRAGVQGPDRGGPEKGRAGVGRGEERGRQHPRHRVHDPVPATGPRRRTARRAGRGDAERAGPAGRPRPAVGRRVPPAHRGLQLPPHRGARPATPPPPAGPFPPGGRAGAAVPGPAAGLPGRGLLRGALREPLPGRAGGVSEVRRRGGRGGHRVAGRPAGRPARRADAAVVQGGVRRRGDLPPRRAARRVE